MHMGKLLRSVQYVTRVQNILENIERVLRVVEHLTVYRTELSWMGIKRCYVSHAITKLSPFVINVTSSARFMLMMKTVIQYVIYVYMKAREYVRNVEHTFRLVREGYVQIAHIKIVIAEDLLLGAMHCRYICPRYLSHLGFGWQNEEVSNMWSSV